MPITCKVTLKDSYYDTSKTVSVHKSRHVNKYVMLKVYFLPNCV